MKKILMVLVVALPAAWLVYRWYSAGGDRPQFRTLPVTRGDLCHRGDCHGQRRTGGCHSTSAPDRGHDQELWTRCQPARQDH